MLRPSQLEYHVPSNELSISPPSIPLKSTWISSNLYQLRRDFVVILLEVRELSGDEPPERWVMAARSRNEAKAAYLAVVVTISVLCPLLEVWATSETLQRRV